MSTLEPGSDTSCDLTLPTGPVIPTGLTNEGQILASAPGRAVCSFHEAREIAGALQPYEGNRESGQAITFAAALINQL